MLGTDPQKLALNELPYLACTCEALLLVTVSPLEFFLNHSALHLFGSQADDYGRLFEGKANGSVWECLSCA